MTDPRAPDAGHGRFREFKGTSVAVRNPTAVLLLLAIVVIMGLLAYRGTPKESAPEITIPVVAINTLYPGAAPADVETLVTRVLEDELYTINEIHELTSTSTEGYSSVVAEFRTGTDMEAALARVRERVDLARPDLPGDAEDPSVLEFNISEFPIMQVNVSGEYGLVRLKAVAEDIQERLEQIPEVLEARLSGGLEREVRVDVDLDRLNHYGVAFTDIANAIGDEHVDVPGGVLDVGALGYPVRTEGQFTDTRLLEEVVVSTPNGAPIYVRDLATVDFGFADRDSYARLNGTPVITLNVVQRSGANILETASAVSAVVDAVRPDLPPTTSVAITSDQSEFVQQMVSTLENSIISGLLLVLLGLIFFLGTRTALFTALSIPLSMLLSFIVIGMLGYTLNMIVLFALILALGMLVDNAVVVVENIYRYLESGHDRITATVRGTGEVAKPIIVATATTLAAFAPLLFWPGIVGEFMGYLPRTLIITLSSSIFVALIIIPVLCSLFLRVEGKGSERRMTPAARWTGVGLAAVGVLILLAANPLTALLVAALALLVWLLVYRGVLARSSVWLQERVVPRSTRWYERRLRWALGRRWTILFASFGLFVVSIVTFGLFNPGVEFFPENVPPSRVDVRMDVPAGTGIEFKNRVAERLEAQLGAIDGIEDAQSVVATVGGGGGGGMMGGGGSDGTITVSFIAFEERRADVFRTLAAMQRDLGNGVAGADIRVDREEMGPPGGLPVNLEIIGDDPAVLQRLARETVRLLESSPVIERLDGLESDMDVGRPEMVVRVDRERAALYGLSTALVGNTVRSAIQGIEAAAFRDGNDEYDITVRLDERYRRDLETLQDLVVVADGGQRIPLVSVADWRIDDGPGDIRRKDLNRVATVSSDVRAGENSNAVLMEVQRTLSGFAGELPQGYEMRYTGQQEEQDEAGAFLATAFLVAVFLIAFILVSQFNSLVKPFIILTTVLLSIIGVLLGLVVLRMPFGIIMTGLGIIALAGVVVNNAIVMIDYIDLLQERDGLSRREAVLEGGKVRFRPVLLTTITTVLGLVPLAVGLNFDFFGLFTSLDPNFFWGGEQAAWWRSMAVAVIVGLLFATLLTLFLVPVLYSLSDDVARWLQRVYRGDDDDTAEPAEVSPARITNK